MSSGGRHKLENAPAEIATMLEQRGWAGRREQYLTVISDVERRDCIAPPRISVVVISWKPTVSQFEALRFLEAQRSDHFELVFVDNGAGTVVGSPMLSFADAVVTLTHNTGAYLARNIGAVFTHAPIILFLEDDGIPAPDLLREHLLMFERYEVVSVRGRYVPKSTNSLNAAALHYDVGDRPCPLISNLEGNTSYDSDTFFRAGGWDDEIQFGHGGLDLGLRIFSLLPDRRRQAYSPGPVILHDYVSDQNHLRMKRERQAESYARLRGKHPNWDEWVRSWNEFAGREDLLIRRTRSAP
jgi:glycosyltransferase involved in cell wall biosynthesis